MFLFLSAISTIMTVSFLAYVAMILVPFLRRKPDPEGDAADFEWHMFVPCRDEEAVIGNTITRLRSTLPEAHVWVIDDDSEDATSSIVSSFAASDSMVHLVQRRLPNARTGKGDALNAAYDQLNAFLPSDLDRADVIVCVVDADGEMAENALRQAAGPKAFGNPKVGAAQVTVWMKNRNDPAPVPGGGKLRQAFGRYLIRMQDIEFRGQIAAVQALRQKLNTVGLGGNGQFTRLSVLDEIAKRSDRPWHGSLLEDYELGLHVLFAGYENRHLHDTHVAQEALYDYKRFTVQRTRWSQGNIECIRYVKEIFKSRHFDSMGVLEATYYLILPILQALASLSFFAILLANVRAALIHPGGIEGWLPGFLFLMIFCAVIGIGPFFIWGPLYRKLCEPQATRTQAALWGIGVWLYVSYMYVTLIRALVRINRGKSGWAKTRRNAEVGVAGPIAKDS
jgi:1,2-diacylglycerol 3-beta-glucosyltransferase